jgi:hypothetical protein
MTAMKVLKRMTGSVTRKNLEKSLCERTVGDRWWSDLGAEGRADPDQGRCLEIRCNIWARAQRRREITHHLRGGGTRNIGWGALRWQDLIGASQVRFGKHREIRYLPKKIANFLHEFRGDDFTSLDLPKLPSDRSRIDVHAMLTPLQIAALLRRLQVFYVVKCSIR